MQYSGGDFTLTDQFIVLQPSLQFILKHFSRYWDPFSIKLRWLCTCSLCSWESRPLLEECCFLHCQKWLHLKEAFPLLLGFAMVSRVLCDPDQSRPWEPSGRVQWSATAGHRQPWALSELAEHFHSRVCSGSDAHLEHLKCASETKEANFRFHLF